MVFGVTKALKRGRAINLDLTAETSQIPNLPRANALQLAADASLAQALPGGNLRYDLGLTQVDSKAAGIAYRAVSAAVDWQGNRAILGVIPELFAQGEVRQYWKTSGFRPDIRAEAGIVAQFSNLSAYGFSPSVTLSFARSVSQIVVRDTSNVSVSFAVVSSF